MRMTFRVRWQTKLEVLIKQGWLYFKPMSLKCQIFTVKLVNWRNDACSFSLKVDTPGQTTFFQKWCRAAWWMSATCNRDMLVNHKTACNGSNIIFIQWTHKTSLKRKSKCLLKNINIIVEAKLTLFGIKNGTNKHKTISRKFTWIE